MKYQFLIILLKIDNIDNLTCYSYYTYYNEQLCPLF